MRLSNAAFDHGMRRIGAGLIHMARDLNKALPEASQVLLSRDKRCAEPFRDATAEEIEAASFIAIGKYLETPAQAKLYKSRRGGYLMLERYFSWAHGLFALLSEREAAQRGKEAPPDDTPPLENETYRLGALIAHWIASLCPVIEGWEEMKLEDAEIDRLLAEGKASGQRDRLNRFRNGVYHFQRAHDDSKFTEFWDPNSMAGLWSISLHRAFERFFRTHAAADYDGITEWLTR